MQTPDEIASRQFLVSLRGYDRDEVTRFLGEVAAEQARLRTRIEELERELVDARRASSAGAASAPPSTSDGPRSAGEAFAALGEETTRVLVAAEESAQAIREKAEDRARAELDNARRESRGEVEGARRTAGKIVAEAERRRNAIAEEIRSLEATRDGFMGELRAAMKNVQGAVRGMQPSATGQAAAEDGDRSSDQDEPGPAPASSPSLEGGVLDPDDVGEDDDWSDDLPFLADADEDGQDAPVHALVDPDEVGGDPAGDIEPPAQEDAGTDEAAGPEPAPTPDADAEADAEADTEDARDTDTDTVDTDPEPGPAPEPREEVEAGSEVASDQGSAAGPEPAVADAGAASGPVPLRHQSLSGVRPGMLRRLKRALQDVQNGVLDDIRQAGDEPELEALLPADDDLATIGAVGQMFLTAAYRAGLADGAILADRDLPDDAGDESRVPASAARFRAVLGHEIVAALRATLRAGVEAGERETSLSERVGEVFRDLKGPVVEASVDEHLTRVYGYGLVDLWRELDVTHTAWVLGEEPRCPANACRLNAGEGAVALGEEYPSGDTVPPAHDGCTCGVVPR